MTRRTLAIALGLTPGIGAKTVARIVARNDLLDVRPAAFLKLPREALIEDYRLKRAQAERWLAKREEWCRQAQSLEEDWNDRGLHVLLATDAHYPALLEGFDPDPPGVLFAYGNLSLLSGQTRAVMASRNATPAALDWLEQRVERLVLDGEILIAGHDTPAYQRAAIVPLRWGAPRILVLDQGMIESLGENLDSEPFSAARLWRYQFDPRTDLAISALPPYATYHRSANQMRDRLVAGLAAQIVFAWIGPGGNMERLLKQARRTGRPTEIYAEAPSTDPDATHPATA